MNKIMAMVFAVLAASVTTFADYVYNPSEFNNEPGLYEVRESQDAGFRILIYGNSITKSASAEEYGWMNDCGMAASSRDKDFAHLVIAAMESYLNTNANYAIRNLADLERYYNTTYDIATELADDIAHGADYIVIALGENVTQSGKGFEDALVNLANAFKTGDRNPRIVFRGSFWGGATVSDSRNAAARVGAAFVDASPYGNSTYEAVGMTTHPDINLHPNDLGMQAIANLIIPKLQEGGESPDTVPSVIISVRERVKGVMPGPNTTNDFKDAMLTWFDQRTYPIQVNGGDGEWTIKNASGTLFSNYFPNFRNGELEGLVGCAPSANPANYPWLYFCENGGVQAPDGALTLEAEEFAFHPDDNNDSGKMVIEFVAKRSGWYRIEGSVRSTATYVDGRRDGVRVQESADGENILTVTTTSDNAAHSLETRWVEMQVGSVFTITMDRVEFYGWDATGFKLRVVRDGARVSKAHYRSSLSQAVNEYVANHRADYAAKLLVGGFYVDFGYRTGGADAEHTTFAERYTEAENLVGWKHPGTEYDMFPLVRFNLSGQEVLASGEVLAAKADEWAIHPGRNIYSSLRFKAAQDFGEKYELVFKTRDLNNSPQKEHPGEAFYVRTNGVVAAEYLMPKGNVAVYGLPLEWMKEGDTIDFIMRSQYDDGKNIQCDMTSLSVELWEYYSSGMILILR